MEKDDFAIKNNILSCNFLYVDPKWIPIAKKAKCMVLTAGDIVLPTCLPDLYTINLSSQSTYFIL